MNAFNVIQNVFPPTGQLATQRALKLPRVGSRSHLNSILLEVSWNLGGYLFLWIKNIKLDFKVTMIVATSIFALQHKSMLRLSMFVQAHASWKCGIANFTTVNKSIRKVLGLHMVSCVTFWSVEKTATYCAGVFSRERILPNIFQQLFWTT